MLMPDREARGIRRWTIVLHYAFLTLEMLPR